MRSKTSLSALKKATGLLLLLPRLGVAVDLRDAAEEVDASDEAAAAVQPDSQYVRISPLPWKQSVRLVRIGLFAGGHFEASQFNSGCR